MKTFLKQWFPLLAIGLAGLASFLYWYEDVAPQASVDLRISRQEAIDRSRDYLLGLKYDLNGLTPLAHFVFDSETHLYLSNRYGVGRASEIIRADSLSTHYWQASYIDPRVSRSQALHSYTVWMTPTGRILGFSHAIQDTARGISLSEEEAIEYATEFLISQNISLNGFRSDRVIQKRMANRTDYDFNWIRSSADRELSPQIALRVQGNEIGYFRENLRPEGEFRRSMSEIGTAVAFLYSGTMALTFLLFFFIVIFFLKKYHDGEVGVQTALVLFLALYAVSVVGNVLQYPATGHDTSIGDVNKSNVQIVLLIFSTLVISVFLQVMVFAGWSVGESYARSRWAEKLVGIDSILRGRFFTRNVARGVIRGYALGAAILGLLTALGVWSLEDLSGFGIFTPTLHGIPDSYFPALLAITMALEAAAINEVVYRLFFMSIFRGKFRRSWAPAVLSSLLFPLTAFALWDFPFGYTNLEILYPVYAGIGLMFAVVFLKYDLLTSLTANFIVLAAGYGLPLFGSTGAIYQTQLWLFAAFLGVPLLVAVVGLLRREEFSFTPQTLPAHIRRISERERMAKELEIARNVQLSLLPKENPVIPGFDVAGICIPALEVGGDYYDFVHLGNGKIGIAIGDVSGKGVPAAIYMTLTKGILQSHAEETISPREVLSKVNKLMYRTIDRHSFVSMFYAVVDTSRRTMRFSRAGHNPVIFAERSGGGHEFLIPKGIALGLDDGAKFDETLEERESILKSGDLLVFYTDGFVEAVRKDGEEFGEERLVASIVTMQQKPSREIIDGIVSDVRRFVGDFPQRDDMTMVVVKVF